MSFILTNISLIYTFLRGFSKSLVRGCRFLSGVGLIFKYLLSKANRRRLLFYTTDLANLHRLNSDKSHYAVGAPLAGARKRMT